MVTLIDTHTHINCLEKITAEESVQNALDNNVEILLVPAATPEVEAALKKINPKGSVKENSKRDGSFEYYLSEPIRDNDAKGVGPFGIRRVQDC